MVLIAQLLNPAVWRDWIHASVDQLGYTAFWLAVLQIIFVDLLLSGDNAVVIAMACRGLPPQRRGWGIVIGTGVAILLRVIFVGIVARLMLLPYLKLVGGVALLVIAAKLIVPDDPDTNEIKEVSRLWRAVMIIAVADIVMSLDNMVAIAAIAQGNLLLLAIGLMVAIPLIMVGAVLVVTLIDRFPVLIWAGSALLGWVAGDVVATDPAIAAHVAAAFGERVAHEIELAAAGAGALLAIGAGGLWRNRRAITRAAAARKPATDRA
jgi:YjbE family integral membrane protein